MNGNTITTDTIRAALEVAIESGDDTLEAACRAALNKTHTGRMMAARQLVVDLMDDWAHDDTHAP